MTWSQRSANGGSCSQLTSFASGRDWTVISVPHGIDCATSDLVDGSVSFAAPSVQECFRGRGSFID